MIFPPSSSMGSLCLAAHSQRERSRRRVEGGSSSRNAFSERLQLKLQLVSAESLHFSRRRKGNGAHRRQISLHKCIQPHRRLHNPTHIQLNLHLNQQSVYLSHRQKSEHLATAPSTEVTPGSAALTASSGTVPLQTFERLNAANIPHFRVSKNHQQH